MLAYSRLAYKDHDHDQCIVAALKKAEAVCEKKNVRLTAIREHVFKEVWSSHQPVGAYDIVDNLALNVKTGKRIKAPSVYRALEFLVKLRLIHRISTLNAYIGRSFPEKIYNNFFLICRDCHVTAECSTDQINNVIEHTAQRTGFLVEQQIVEIIGLCPECKKEE
jgi:Fur family zinc uptake transcriptional regulator